MARERQVARKSTTIVHLTPTQQRRLQFENELRLANQPQFPLITPSNLDTHPLNNMSQHQRQQQQQQQPVAAVQQPVAVSAGSAVLNQQVVQPDGSRARSVQTARRTNPMASHRSQSQERDPDYPSPGRGARQSYRRGQVGQTQPTATTASSSPAPAAASHNDDRNSGRASTSGSSSNNGSNNPSPTLRGTNRRLQVSQPPTPTVPVSDHTVIEQTQTALVELTVEVSQLRIEMAQDREKIMSMRSEWKRLNNVVNELRAELSSNELVALRDKVNELEARLQSQQHQPQQQASSSGGCGDSPPLAHQPAGGCHTNGAGACLGEAVVKLVLGQLGGNINSRKSCNCSQNSNLDQP